MVLNNKPLSRSAQTQARAQVQSDQALDDQPELARTLQGLRALIDQQMARSEHRLPPERELAALLGVGRATLRKALAQVAQDGLLRRHVGRGTFIATGASQSPQGLHALSIQGALAIGHFEGLSPRELLEVRLVIEPAMAELAAGGARAENIAEMQRCLQEREQASQADAYEHWDFQLHTAIAKATHNRLLVELLELVNRMRRTANWRQFRRDSVTPAKKRKSNAQHRAIVDAIVRADGAAAHAAMRAHVSGMLETYLASPAAS